VLPYGTYKLTLKIKDCWNLWDWEYWDLCVKRDDLNDHNNNVLCMDDNYKIGTFVDYFTAEIVSGGYIWTNINGEYEITVTPVN
jgi:hypothetical protein